MAIIMGSRCILSFRVAACRRITYSVSPTVRDSPLCTFWSTEGQNNSSRFRLALAPAGRARFTTRRRRGGGTELAHPPQAGIEEDGDYAVEKPLGTRHDATTDASRFKRKSSELLDKLYAALHPLGPPVNDHFVLVRGKEEDLGEYLLLDLGPVHGQYTIQVDEGQALVLLCSPISGQIYYVLSASTGEFCGLDDGHALEGLLVRDLIRQIYGVPQL